MAIRVVSLFCGIGGSDLGLYRAAAETSNASVAANGSRPTIIAATQSNDNEDSMTFDGWWADNINLQLHGASFVVARAAWDAALVQATVTDEVIESEAERILPDTMTNYQARRDWFTDGARMVRDRIKGDARF